MSDTRDETNDTSGQYLADAIVEAGHRLAGRSIVLDEVDAIQAQVKQWVRDPGIDVILSTGGTGFNPRDVTPEAVRPLLRREMDGFAVLFHHASHGTVGKSTLQSRALAGQIGGCFIFCLPGSTGACRDGWTLVLGTSSTAATSPARWPGRYRASRRCAHESTDPYRL